MNWRPIRTIGMILIFLGFGSAITRTYLNFDTVLTAWMGAAQPWAGIVMGLVGVALVVVVVQHNNRLSESEPVG